MAVCVACGTENRDNAMFCRGCATSMVALVGAAPAPAPQEPVNQGPTQSCPACQAKNPLVATSCKSCGASLVPDIVAPKAAAASAASSGRAGRFAVMVALVLATTAVGAWWLNAHKAEAPAVAAPAPPVSAPAVAHADDAVHVSSSGGAAGERADGTVGVAAAEEQAVRAKQQAAAQASAERTRRDRERREKEARDKAAAEQRRLAQAEQARRNAAEAARQATAGTVAQAVAQAPEPVRTVDQACAGSGGFISRDVCRTRECRNPGFRNDPICVRFRQVEAANLPQPMF